MEDQTRMDALVQHVDGSDDTEVGHLYDNVYEVDGAEYLVVSDAEAADLYDESLDSYIDECILPELPERLSQYFDRAAFKRDAAYDGRGYGLAHYDGEEHEEYIDGEYVYIYRTG